MQIWKFLKKTEQLEVAPLFFKLIRYLGVTTIL